MAKEVSCGDVVEGCPWKGSAASEEELLQKVVAHAADAHHVTQVSPELAAQVKAAIRER